jgi:hypothetical protein
MRHASWHSVIRRCFYAAGSPVRAGVSPRVNTTRVLATISPILARWEERAMAITPKMLNAGSPSTSLSKFLTSALAIPGRPPSMLMTRVPTAHFPIVAPTRPSRQM